MKTITFWVFYFSVTFVQRYQTQILEYNSIIQAVNAWKNSLVTKEKVSDTLFLDYINTILIDITKS